MLAATACIEAFQGCILAAMACIRPRCHQICKCCLQPVGSAFYLCRLSFLRLWSLLTLLQAQEPSAAPARTPQAAPAFGRSLGRSVSRGSRDSSSSDSTRERAAAEAAAINSQPAASSSSKGGMFGMAFGVWRKATSKLFDLEAKIANQVGHHLAALTHSTNFTDCYQGALTNSPAPILPSSLPLLILIACSHLRWRHRQPEFRCSRHKLLPAKCLLTSWSSSKVCSAR